MFVLLVQLKSRKKRMEKPAPPGVGFEMGIEKARGWVCGFVLQMCLWS